MGNADQNTMAKAETLHMSFLCMFPGRRHHEFSTPGLSAHLRPLNGSKMSKTGLQSQSFGEKHCWSINTPLSPIIKSRGLGCSMSLALPHTGFHIRIWEGELEGTGKHGRPGVPFPHIITVQKHPICPEAGDSKEGLWRPSFPAPEMRNIELFQRKSKIAKMTEATTAWRA